MSDPVHHDEIDALSDATGQSEDDRQAAMVRLFTDTAGGQLCAHCYERFIEKWCTDVLPTNATFIFYELEQRGIVTKDRGINPKTGKRYERTHRQDISDAAMKLREAGLVPWGWLTDETRDIIVPLYAASVREYVLDLVDGASIDAWGGGLPPLTICEARGVKAVLERIAYRYVAPLAATAGQSGGYIVTEIVPRLTGKGAGRDVFYIGDWEVGGPAQQIEENTQRRIAEHGGRPGRWTRIALTATQVDGSESLRSKAIVKADKRYRNGGKPYTAVECEALGQAEIIELVRKALDRLRGQRGLEPIEDVLVREDAERDEVRRLLQ
jgi:hypothetical protein